MKVITPHGPLDTKSRLVGIRLAMLTLRLQENWARLFGSQETALIALAIVVITSERFTRTELDPEWESLIVPMPSESLADCNISSIAAATGLNRETTRRKVDQLVAEGLIVREGGAIRISPDISQRKDALRVVQMQLQEIRRAINDLLRMNAVGIEPA